MVGRDGGMRGRRTWSSLGRMRSRRLGHWELVLCYYERRGGINGELTSP